MNFQLRVWNWMQACFGTDDTASIQQRAWRMLEEANEFAQACGVTREEAHQLVDYVQGRPAGDPAQEAGGVLVTVAGLCAALDLDMEHAGEVELNRCWVKLPAIQAKNAAKKADSALPGAAPPDRLQIARAEAAQQEIEGEAWNLYCDDNRNNPMAVSTWAGLSGQLQMRYIGRALAASGKDSVVLPVNA